MVELVAEEPEGPGRGTPREEQEEAPILAEELAEAVLLASYAGSGATGGSGIVLIRFH